MNEFVLSSIIIKFRVFKSTLYTKMVDSYILVYFVFKIAVAYLFLLLFESVLTVSISPSFILTY
jgi:hypothetical protein